MTAQLVDKWIPALDGVEAKLELGACVALVGGPPELAEVFPRRRFLERPPGRRDAAAPRLRGASVRR
jgi:hypothetical protein